MVHISVLRQEADRIKSNPGWSMVFGRRKVGKTFLIEQFVPFDSYFYVRVDRSVSAKGFLIPEINDVELFKNSVMDLLRTGKTVVVDEFQRFQMKVWEDVSRVHPNGKLILTGSSMKVAREVLGKNSPLLGMLRPFRIDQILIKDLFRAFESVLSPELLLEYAPFLRDPWTIDFFRKEGFVRDLLEMAPYTVPGLVGEVFTEDERELTQVYGSILSLLGAGYTDYKEIGNILFTRGLTSSPSSSSVIPYLKAMVDMGLLERTRRFGTEKYVYTIPSFPIWMYYHLESRYGLNRAGFSLSEVEPTLSKIHDLSIEGLVADLFAETLDAQKEFLKDDKREIDILITRRGDPILVGEVKWGKATKSDISSFLDKVTNFNCQKVFVTKKKIETDEVDVITPSDLVRIGTGKDPKYTIPKSSRY